MRIAVGASKGGAGKTTTAVHLATGLALRGEPTVLVDADVQQSATAWWRTAERRDDSWPVTLSLMAWPRGGVQGFPSLREAGHVVVDTGPGEGIGRFRDALNVADVVIVASQATDLDIAQVGGVVEHVEKAGQTRALTYAVLLTRTRLGRNLNRARAGLTEGGVPVWDTLIPHREDMVPSFGQVPTFRERHAWPYADLLTEIITSQED